MYPATEKLCRLSTNGPAFRQNCLTVEASNTPLLLPFNPFCPISAAKVAGLKATVNLLLLMLLKSKLLRIKMSLLGSLIGLALLAGFLLSTGLLTLVTGGAVAYAASKNRSN